MSRKLTYVKNGVKQVMCDADWPANGDPATSGWVINHSGAPIVWASRKQRTTSLSTYEAELNALIECIKDVIWIRTIMKSVGIAYKPTTKISCDNASVVSLSTHGTVPTRKVRYMLTRVNIIKEWINTGKKQLTRIATTDNIADHLTKITSSSHVLLDGGV
jgi:hypothetical protein